jgi:hypothetical protein
MGKLAVLAAAIALFQTIRAPVVIGKQGAALTGDDLAAIRALAEGSGTPIWIVDVRPVPDTLRVTVYRQPDRTSAAIRRGHLFTATRGYAAPERTSRPWVVVESGTDQPVEYAQVPIPGREPDDVRDEVDDNRPFIVNGELGDADLIGLVNYVRQARLGRGPIIGVAPRHVLPRPPRPDGATVTIRTRSNPECTETYELRRTGDSWSRTGGSGFGCP